MGSVHGARRAPRERERIARGGAGAHVGERLELRAQPALLGGAPLDLGLVATCRRLGRRLRLRPRRRRPLPLPLSLRLQRGHLRRGGRRRLAQLGREALVAVLGGRQPRGALLEGACAQYHGLHIVEVVLLVPYLREDGAIVAQFAEAIGFPRAERFWVS